MDYTNPCAAANCVANLGCTTSTGSRIRPRRSAIACENGVITAIGRDEDVLHLAKPHTRIINAEGRTVIPGLNDSHLHYLGYAITKNEADISAARSVNDIVEIMRRHIKDKNISIGSTVIGNGYNENFFNADKGTSPTKADLDKISTTHPICIKRACRHVCVVNSAMLAKCNITASTNIPGGEIITVNGEPTGVLTENALDIINSQIVYTKDDLKRLIVSAQPDLAKYGITSIATDDFYPMFPYQDVVAAYTALAENGLLTVRVTEKTKALDIGALRNMLALPQTCEDIRPFFRLGPVKILADGSLGARTAFMLDDYADDPGNRGLRILDEESLHLMIKTLHNAGYDAAVHTIGDGALKMALDAMEAAQRATPRKNARHGVVHAQITTPELIRRMAGLNVFAYIQPIFIHADTAILNARVGAAKAATSYAFRTMYELGIKTPMGTDCPVEPLNPFNNIYCAVTQKTLDGMMTLNQHETMSVMQTVQAYTTHGAYATREECVKGKLAPGYYADMAILTKNIFEIPADEIPTTEVYSTIVNGALIE